MPVPGVSGAVLAHCAGYPAGSGDKPKA